MLQEMGPCWFLAALDHLGIAAQLCKVPLENFIPAFYHRAQQGGDPTSVAPLCLAYTLSKKALTSHPAIYPKVFSLAVERIR